MGNELIDPFPFVELPPGAQVRELPAGGRLVTLADGVMIRVAADGGFVAVLEDGTIETLTVEGEQVRLSNGLSLAVRSADLRVTHEAAGISGLPESVTPWLASTNHVRAELPDGSRLEVFRQQRLVLLVSPGGPVLTLSPRKIEGYGDEAVVRFLPGGGRGFSTSGPRGIIDIDGTVNLTTSGGDDLVIRFLEPELPEDQGRRRTVELCPGDLS